MTIWGWLFVLGLLVVAGLVVNTAVQGNRQVDSAKATALHVTHCWKVRVRHGWDRYCALRWSLPDGTWGSGSIREDDTSIDTGSTIHGWATPTKAWTSSPKRRSSSWDWVVVAVIVLGPAGLGYYIWRQAKRNQPT
jgi:hypothetical protein